MKSDGTTRRQIRGEVSVIASGLTRMNALFNQEFSETCGNHAGSGEGEKFTRPQEIPEAKRRVSYVPAQVIMERNYFIEPERAGQPATGSL